MAARASAAALLALLAAPAGLSAETPRFALPVDCRPGVDCFVQNYVDTDPGPTARDFTCGPLTYDKHRGIDIRVATFAEMRAGVVVRAAAAGRVLNLRDEMADGGWKGDEDERRLCGNGVLIAHGDGWTSQYCHMKRGSIAVGRGQAVSAGERLGEIGYSGKTEFPHLHFAVRQGKTVYDPFTGRAMEAGCGARDGEATLWTEAAAAALAYRASGLLAAGFADRAPERQAVEDGAFKGGELPATAPALVFWVEVFGLRRGDVESLRLIDAAGHILAETRTEPAERHRAVQFRFVGKRRRGALWPVGDYLGEYRLLRADGGERKEVLAVKRRLLMR